jgi:serine protease Do
MSIFNLDANLIEWNLKTAQKFDDPVKNVIQKGLQSSCTVFVMDESGEWSGSGFHIGNGLIVTASHVIPPDLTNKKHKIEITFDSQTLYPAEIYASEPNIDAGILQCPQIANNIPSLSLGDSDAVEVGDLIAVIGAPEGFHDTATVGRISNVHQGLGPDSPSAAWNDILFYDADILEGSSGGMLINMDGAVVGIVMGVTGKHADIGVGENAACPSNKIKGLLV